MKVLDRGLQRDLLNQLAERYPNPIGDMFHPEDLEEPTSVNLHYLEEHGLVQLYRSDLVPNVLRHLHPHASAPLPQITGGATITAAGMDFLTNDGGLSSILGTVTVRLHADTIRDLIETRIQESDAPIEEKVRITELIRSLPEESLKHLITKLIDYGLSNTPGMWQALTGML